MPALRRPARGGVTMIERFDPLRGEMLRVLDDEGRARPDLATLDEEHAFLAERDRKPGRDAG